LDSGFLGGWAGGLVYAFYGGVDVSVGKGKLELFAISAVIAKRTEAVIVFIILA
jgi:hypothetical protein